MPAHCGFILWDIRSFISTMNYAARCRKIRQQALHSTTGRFPLEFGMRGSHGIWSTRGRSKNKKETPEWVMRKQSRAMNLWETSLWLPAVSGLLGAKIFHNLEYPETC